MTESATIAKEADTKRGSSSTQTSEEGIRRAQHDPERQLGSLGGVIGNIMRDGGTPSADSIATHLSSMHASQRAPVLLALQQTHGNRYVQRVVAGIQAKLKIGQPGDVYEQEADRVADSVIRMPILQVYRQPEDGVDDEKILQAETVPGKTTDPESPISRLRGGGKPLSKSERTFFEPRFGRDFGAVKIHNDSQAAKTAKAVNANAFTVGNDIFFGAGEYRSDTTAGRQLIGHELVHVIQQKGNRISRRTFGEMELAAEYKAKK